MESAEQVADKVRRTLRELRICMFCLGVKTIGELRTRKLVRGL
jgi:isopentenyl diphosphate isomerase/L-lactate dehydrogenase-like FMN-dependent dehydrogenase